jgi:short-subunit dehydrogenase
MSEVTRATVVVMGATSAIGRAVARRLAERGHAVVLAGRDADELEHVAADLAVRARVPARTYTLDASEPFDPAAFLKEALAGEPFAGIVVAHGALVDVGDVVHEPERIDRLARVNFASAASLAEAAATRLGASGRGFVAVVSSIAGDVGRRTNYPYGATKAGLSTYLQGLRGRVRPLGVDVLTVSPGFVDTSMTWGMLDPDSPLVARPDAVARALVRGLDRRARVVYAPAFWRWVSWILRALPESVLHRLPF